MSNTQQTPTDLKRSNFSPEEFIHILEGQLIEVEPGTTPDDCVLGHNDAIQSTIWLIKDFLLDEEESGAVAYSPSTKKVYTIN